MCGITGFIGNCENNEKTIKDMMESIKHRGPDGNGFYTDDYATLGHVRLSIIDVKGGIQPMYSSDKNYCIVFNGEIYNYIELKEELKKKYKFKTNSDTEVLLYSYIEYKEKMLDKIRGMFSFVIYDKKEKTLFGARDHFGIKPFYYYKNNDVFMFSSEIKAFLKNPLFNKEFNESVLPDYLSFNFVPTEETFFKDVYKLAPGHYFIYKNSKLTIKKYFDITFTEKELNRENAINRIEDVMKDSVEKHMRSDVLVGSFLSSGVDSSYLVSLARPDLTYTIGYNNKKYNELEYAQDLTKRLGIKNKYKIIEKEEYFKTLPKVIYHLDEPLADPSEVSLYFLSKLASKDVKVCLSGEGADELFGGYNYYVNDKILPIYNKVPKCIRHFIAKICVHLPEVKGINFFIRRGLTLEENYCGVNKVFSEKERNYYLKKKNKKKNRDITASTFNKTKNNSDLIKMQAVDFEYWLQKDILLKADKMSMANSLEVRVPFLDKEVFKVASELAPNTKIDGNQTKYALRQAAKRVIPNESYNKKKLGFPVPLRDWLKEDDVYKEIKTSIDSNFSKEIFNNKRLNKLLDKVYTGKTDKYKKLWTIYIFLKWHEIYFEN